MVLSSVRGPSSPVFARCVRWSRLCELTFSSAESTARFSCERECQLLFKLIGVTEFCGLTHHQEESAKTKRDVNVNYDPINWIGVVHKDM